MSLALIALVVLSACATPVRPISEDERCTRFGGAWQAGHCQPPGGDGGM